MLDPVFAFNAAGPLVMAGWLALLVSLFVPVVRPAVWTATQFLVPAILAVAYILLIWTGMTEAEGGGFGSIGEIRALFANDSALVAGWFHYLAFDLFIGSWIVRNGVERGIPGLLILPCLPLTFLLGPTGLLLFLVMRLAWRPRPIPETI